MTLKMSRASERGVLKHFAYLIEAAAILPILDQNGVEHLHVHFGTNAAAVARLIRRLGGPAYSMTVHGPVEFDAPIGFSLKEKAAEAKFVVAISDFCFAQLCRWVPPDQWSKIHIVHCSAGDAYFESDMPIDDSSRMLLSIGRLDAQKGQVLLLDAIKIAVDQGVDVQLTLVGDGELRPLIEQRINSYGLSRHVNITGWLDESNIRNLLQQARALVQPSFAEGLPVVIMEAFAMARPVISTHVAAIPELVRHHVNGWLVPAGNLDELVAAIKDVMTLPADRLNAMGQAGRDRAIARHNTKEQVTLLESLIDSSVTSTNTV
jgi:glycosyltransferase involved in cell wall biosynthesis